MRFETIGSAALAAMLAMAGPVRAAGPDIPDDLVTARLIAESGAVAPGATAPSSGTSRAVTGCGSAREAAGAGAATASATHKAAKRTACRAKYPRSREAISGGIIAEIAAIRRPGLAGMAAEGWPRYRLPTFAVETRR